LPDELKSRHPEIPWAKVAGIGNVLRHEYEGIAPTFVIASVPLLVRAGPSMINRSY
jgi:uncharacterized protein with HEPN domain